MKPGVKRKSTFLLTCSTKPGVTLGRASCCYGLFKRCRARHPETLDISRTGGESHYESHSVCVCTANNGRSHGFMSRTNVGFSVSSEKEIGELVNTPENNCKRVTTFFKMHSDWFLLI